MNIKKIKKKQQQKTSFVSLQEKEEKKLWLKKPLSFLNSQFFLKKLF